MIYLLLIDTEEDKRKFVILYEKYRYFMLKVAMSILKDYHEAEDMVHEAFIKIAKKMEYIGDVESYETKRYLVIVTRNTAIDFYRKKKRCMGCDTYIDELSNCKTLATYIDSELEGVEQIMKIMSELPPIYRDVFILRFAYQYEVKKIAEILNLTEINVRQRLLRGRQMIEKVLNEMEDE